MSAKWYNWANVPHLTVPLLLFYHTTFQNYLNNISSRPLAYNVKLIKISPSFMKTSLFKLDKEDSFGCIVKEFQ